jgi:hypothetical protein
MKSYLNLLKLSSHSSKYKEYYLLLVLFLVQCLFVYSSTLNMEDKAAELSSKSKASQF